MSPVTAPVAPVPAHSRWASAAVSAAPGGPGIRGWASLPREAVALLRSGARTTPGLLRIAAVALTALITLFWAAALASTLVRQSAVDAVRDRAGPSFVAAQRLHADLSAADATVAIAYLAGTIEPAERRQAYDSSIEEAGRELAALTRAGGGDEARAALETVVTRLPVYTGWVEQARANNRQGHVVGAAYLWKASKLMREEILPAVETFAAINADRIDDGYRRGTHWSQPTAVAVLGAATLAALAGAQWLLFRRANRVLNPWLLTATLLMAASLVVTLAVFSAERARLVEARDQGFVPMAEVGQARVLGLRVWGDHSLSLIARGDSSALDADAAATTERLGKEVLPAVAALAGPDQETRTVLRPAWVTYEGLSGQAYRLVTETAGRFPDAVAITVGDGAVAFERYDAAAAAAFESSALRFGEGLAAADGRLPGLAVAVSVLAAAGVALMAIGLWRRIEEYR
ncbi:hypothetical protein I6A84_38135 [Frankia sp. CNm7]|uniref:Secreted protein n=1 Tax=Frankia nepalensis TaxID=1836974 RepID=A0A937RCP6_9ACTN|nr:hypothetical protein [Frankia nepalensis]MBL7495853.1 hypothetical protein [Frankia nepalensis]MBL7509929.1 hypothetical protein [Frankia nepalensis]MBL7523706.1 hypothetical protein [Frankia nepalensis]MBL7629688.1 hypothetical protein [Frankia nepalensis]